jgi:hypothetical protein
MSIDLAALRAHRLAQWRQTPQTRLADAQAGAELIQQLGIATLYPVSPEVPNLFSAYVGDPEAQTDSGHDTPSGEIYTWRWTLGRKEVAFYAPLVRGRPTWVRWDLLPAVLRLCGETRTPDELSDMGIISAGAYRIAQALEECGGTLSTGELRKAAGFPTGKAERAAFLKAVAELDARLMLAKVFAPGDESDQDMRHALVALRYRDQVAAADRLTHEQALDAVLSAYLPHAVYAVPPTLAKHLKLDDELLRTALERMVAAGQAVPATFPEHKGTCYVWADAAEAP